MKNTFKIIFVALIGVFIGYSIADYSSANEEVVTVSEDKARNHNRINGYRNFFWC